jgi:hypothetical protein
MFHERLRLAPRFDFARFYKDQLFTDCEIRVFHTDTEYQPVLANRAVLANSSVFFFNMFTSGTRETTEGVVEVRGIPYEPFVALVEFLYSGKLVMYDNVVMIFRFLSRHFGVQVLQEQIEEYIKGDEAADGDKIIQFIDQCFDYELTDELVYLEPIIAARYNLISVRNLSESLDVATFTRVLAIRNMPTRDRMKQMEVFLDNWKCSGVEKAAIGELFADGNDQFKTELMGRHKDWLPEDWA